MNETILVLGASGQIGTELTEKLRSVYGKKQVIASDIRGGNAAIMASGPFEIIDATDKETILKTVKKYKVTQVYLLAAMLSAPAEKYPSSNCLLSGQPTLAAVSADPQGGGDRMRTIMLCRVP